MADSWVPIYQELKALLGFDIPSWNDALERTFADILKVVDEIERLELAGELK